MSKLIGTSLIFIVLSFHLMSSGNLMLFIDIPSVIYVIGMVLGSLLATLGFSKTIRFSESSETQSKFFHVGKVSSIITGILGTLSSFVVMFNYMSDDTSKIGLAIAVSILTLIYSCLSYLIFFLWEQSKI